MERVSLLKTLSSHQQQTAVRKKKQNCSSLAPQNDIQWELAVNQIIRRQDTIPYSCPQILIEFWPHIGSCNYPLQDHKLMYMWLVVTLKDSCLILAMSKYGQQTYVYITVDIVFEIHVFKNYLFEYGLFNINWVWRFTVRCHSKQVNEHTHIFADC